MIQKIAFIGAGSMAEAIIEGMVNKKVVKSEYIYVANKENEARLEELKAKYNIVGNTNKEEVIQDSDVVIFATKPYDMENAILDTREFIQPHHLVISVVAGISTDFITDRLGKEVAVIRSMPNTSAAVGYSATAITKGKYATDAHLLIAERLFKAIGTVSVVDEDKMHIVTGISGSGPAYVYYLVEAMEKAAHEEGLDENTTKQLITQTIIGAGEMLKQAKDPVNVLRENVTSPNGTTAAGIQTLSEYQFQEAVVNCVKNATKRSVELGED
ncbi:pyrroline-5-carboxylate reductase [Pseudogracilibacillus sp. SE30717A]|uniref:pyrroline-5-carboxylate reductase n=1 Tax=Pseudogracilibacillus sp. SE30717A TaxID=3098293 RepID=UPI00300E6BB7